MVSGAGLAPGQIASGIVAFNPDGSLDMTKTTLFGTPPNPTFSIGASAAAAPGAGGANWAASLGVAAQSVTFGIGGSTGSGSLTQVVSPSVVSSINTNGTPFGSLSAVSIGQNGVVTATFDNGTSRQLAQVAMATFPNVDGLTAVNGDAYLASQAAGDLSLKAAGTGGAGTLSSSTLEVFHSRSLDRIHQSDHRSTGLRRLVENHHHGRPNDSDVTTSNPIAGTNTH